MTPVCVRDLPGALHYVTFRGGSAPQTPHSKYRYGSGMDLTCPELYTTTPFAGAPLPEPFRQSTVMAPIWACNLLGTIH